MKKWKFEKLKKLNSSKDIEEIKKGIKQLDVEINILLETHIRYEELKTWQKELEKRITSIIWET